MVRLAWNAASRTYLGPARQRIEDDIYAGPSLFAIADGRKGRTAGDIASHLVTEALRKYDREIDPSNLTTIFERGIYSADESIRGSTRAGGHGRQPGGHGVLWDHGGLCEHRRYTGVCRTTNRQRDG